MIENLHMDFPNGRHGVALLLMRFFTGVAFVMHGSGKLGDVVDFSAEYPRARFYGRGDCEDDRREVRGDIPHPKRHVAASELHPARHPTPVHGHISFIN